MGRVWTSQTIITAPPLDSATQAWINAVIANGGTVGGTVQTVMDNFIVGLKTDGLFGQLDRFWMYATENTPSALTDIIALELATAINSPTFTALDGFTGNGSNSYIDSNFNPTTAPSPKFVQNSACMFCWDITANTSRSGLFGYSATTIDIRLNANGGAFNAEINTVDFSGLGDSGSAGLLLMTTNGSTGQFDLNGTQLTTTGGTAAAPQNFNFVSLTERNQITTHQLACYGFGANLSPTDRTNLYSRVRTYMTAVGVP